MYPQEHRIGIFLAGGSAALREGVRALITSQEDLYVVAESETGKEAIEICIERRPEILLLDVRIPDLSAREVTGRVKAAQANARIVLLTPDLGNVAALHALDCGADAVVVETNLRLSLLRVLRTVASH